ncbi:MAG: dephospho-CoA kinase [Synergistaceae bacterium]|nr:dephospho-CoA kinase [Synergistaceae bacterium]
MAAIAITGDIGAGKSTVSKLLAEKLGCERLDADVVAKNLWLRDDVKAQAVNRWGEKILDASGKILIPEIARIIFTDETEHEYCNKMLHPLVMSELKRRAANIINREFPSTSEQARKLEKVIVSDNLSHVTSKPENVVIEIPLLFEAGSSFDWINFVVYVTANFDVRAERCRVSRGWSFDELRRREKFLLPQNEKISMSDYIINNDGGISELERQIDDIRLY